MAIANRPNTYTSDTTIVPAQVNDDFDTLYDAFNGGIDDTNIATSGITTDTIADSNVTTAKIADNAVTTAKIINDAVTADKLTATYTSATLSASWTSAASATWQDTGFDVTLATAGTWVLMYNVRVSSPANLNDFGVIRLYNETTAAVVTDSHRISVYPTGASQVTIPLSEIIETTTANNVIRLEFNPMVARAGGIIKDTNGVTKVIAWRIA